MEGRTKGSGGAWVYREHTVYITTTWIWRTTSGEVTDTTPIIPRTDQASSLMTCFEAQGITFYFLKSRQSIPLWEHKNWSWTQSSSWRKKGQSPFAGESKGMIFHPGPGGGGSETLRNTWIQLVSSFWLKTRVKIPCHATFGQFLTSFPKNFGSLQWGKKTSAGTSKIPLVASFSKSKWRNTCMEMLDIQMFHMVVGHGFNATLC